VRLWWSEIHPINVEVLVEHAGREAKPRVIRAYETEIWRVTGDRRRDESSGVRSAKVTSFGPPGAIRAAGFVTYGPGYGHTIRFYDNLAVRQPNLFAANVTALNSDLFVTLKNVSDQPITAVPEFWPVTENTPSVPFTLAPVDLLPGEEKLLDVEAVSRLAQTDPNFARLSVHVKNSGEKGSLIGSLSTFDRRQGIPFEMPLRDSGGLRNFRRQLPHPPG
jgi:hypothetical protein